MSKNGGPAFPCPEIRSSDGAGIKEGTDGMTLRDYFAGQMLVGFWNDRQIGFYSAYDRAKLAQSSYEFADAMLAERGKAGGQ